MSGFENRPAPILRRWLLSAAAGPVIFLIGLAGRIALHDPTLLTLSTLLASCMVVRCIDNLDMDEIYAKFGVDYDLLSTLMTRETDDEGHLRIHWGEQKIA